MSQELRIQFGLTYTNGQLSDQVANHTLIGDQTTQGLDSLTVSVGTTEQDISFPDVGTLGWLYLKNLDPANFVIWGPKSAGVMVPIGKLMPNSQGEAVFQLDPGITLRMKADTAACKVLIKCFNA